MTDKFKPCGKGENICNCKSAKECGYNGDTICHQCGAPNPTWYAENVLFNTVNGSSDGVVCPKCFEEMAAKKDIVVLFRCITDEDEKNIRIHES